MSNHHGQDDPHLKLVPCLKEEGRLSQGNSNCSNKKHYVTVLLTPDLNPLKGEAQTITPDSQVSTPRLGELMGLQRAQSYLSEIWITWSF